MAAVMEEDDSLLAQAWKRIRFLGQELFRLDGKVHGLEATIADLGEPVRMDPDAPPTSPPRDYEDENAPLFSLKDMRFAMGLGAQQSRRFGGIHGGGSTKAVQHAWSVISIAITLAVGVWVRDSIESLESTSRAHSQQLARIECQLSPETCRQLQVPHVP
jgi:hypothetical protein